MGSNQMVRIAVSSLVVEPLVGVLEDDQDYEISGETKPCDWERGESKLLRERCLVEFRKCLPQPRNLVASI
jgi:hypothetical protein